MGAMGSGAGITGASRSAAVTPFDSPERGSMTKMEGVISIRSVYKHSPDYDHCAVRSSISV